MVHGTEHAGSEWLKFGKHLPGPFFLPSGVLRGEREAEMQTPNHCLTLPRSAPPRATARIRLHSERPENPRGDHDTHQDLSSHLRAGRRERGRQESERARRGWLWGPGGRGRGRGSGWQRSQEAPRGLGSREERKYLFLTFGLELIKGTGLGVNYKNVHHPRGRGEHRTGHSTRRHPGNLGWLQT